MKRNYQVICLVVTMALSSVRVVGATPIVVTAEDTFDLVDIFDPIDLTGFADAAAPDLYIVNDLTDTVFATLNANPNPLPLLPDSHGEFIHFRFNVVGAPGGAIANRTRGYRLVEGFGGPTSDILIAQAFAGSVVVDIMFGSDPDFPTVPPGLSLASLIERGTVQPLVGAVSTSTGAQLAQISVQSDAPELPEPTTLLLLGSGLVTLRKRIWKRHSAN